MEGVQEVVVVVDAEIDRSSSGLDDLFQVFKHVDVREEGQLFKLLSFKECHNKLAQGVFPTALIWIGNHCIISLFIMAEFEVMRK